MRGLIVYGRDGYEDGGEFVDQVDAIASEGNDITLVIADEMAIGIHGDEVFAKLPDGTVLSEGSRDLPAWAMMRTSDWTCAYALEQMGVRTFPTSDYIRTASDKVASHLAMAPHLDSLDALLRRGTVDASVLSAPYIVKSAIGFGGHDVTKANTTEEGAFAVSGIEEAGGAAMVQRLASSPDDLRVYIMGGKVMFAILRKASEGSDKANFCQGAKGIPYELSDEERERIEHAAAAFPGNLGFISIDFLFDSDGRLVFNEMNCFPGLAGLVQMGWQGGFVEKYIGYIEDVIADGK